MSLLPQWMARQRHQSINRNLYHCTVQKSASQWLRGILSDPRTVRCCGLNSFQYDHRLPDGRLRRLTDRTDLGPFPDGAIVTPLYVDYEGYAALPKRTPCKGFFVMRDPRDVLVSWYFSIKKSHSASPEVTAVRAELERRNLSDGLLYALDFLVEYGLFQAQRSWAAADASVLLLHYEDLTGPDSRSFLARLFEHCDIRLPAEEMGSLLASHSFERLSGRRRGDEDAGAHYRKGVAGDWRNYFDRAVDVRFAQHAGDVITLWNYP